MFFGVNSFPFEIQTIGLILWPFNYAGLIHDSISSILQVDHVDDQGFHYTQINFDIRDSGSITNYDVVSQLCQN